MSGSVFCKPCQTTVFIDTKGCIHLELITADTKGGRGVRCKQCKSQRILNFRNWGQHRCFRAYSAKIAAITGIDAASSFNGRPRSVPSGRGKAIIWPKPEPNLDQGSYFEISRCMSCRNLCTFFQWPKCRSTRIRCQ